MTDETDEIKVYTFDEIEEQLNDCNCNEVCIMTYLDNTWGKGYKFVYNKCDNIYQWMNIMYWWQLTIYAITINDLCLSARYIHNPRCIVVCGWSFQEYEATDEYNILKTMYDNNATLPQINDWLEYQQLILK